MNNSLTTSTRPSITLPAPAKINLFLHITGQRADGYHLLQTLFQLLDVGDELCCSLHPSEIIVTPEIPGLASSDNLIYKAATLLRQHCGYQGGACIELTKRLPMGGGLGGGSSDAASTLLALNKLWQLNLPLLKLAQLGQQLGADVPVFVWGYTAWGEGIGELLTPYKTPNHWFLVITPNVHVNTMQIFQNQQLTRNSPAIKIPPALDEWLFKSSRNDCEPLVRNLYPEVDRVLLWLSNFSSEVRMTGTGASVFARFHNRQQAESALANLTAANEQWQGFIAQAVNRSPAHDAIADY